MEAKDLTIVLVHGAWGDGSHWEAVIPLLVKAGYKVRSVQNPLTSLSDDILRTTQLIEAQEGKVLLVGHSYGGSVISNVGNNPKVLGLVYIAAFAPDKGENLGMLLGRRTASGGESIYPDANGFFWIKYEGYHQAFCADISADKAMALSFAQKPTHGQCFGAESGEPAWRTKPSWYQLSNQDNMLPPETQKEMAERMNPKKIVALDASHASLLSKPVEVVALIIEAATSL